MGPKRMTHEHALGESAQRHCFSYTLHTPIDVWHICAYLCTKHLSHPAHERDCTVLSQYARLQHIHVHSCTRKSGRADAALCHRCTPTPTPTPSAWHIVVRIICVQNSLLVKDITRSNRFTHTHFDNSRNLHISACMQTHRCSAHSCACNTQNRCFGDTEGSNPTTLDVNKTLQYLLS